MTAINKSLQDADKAAFSDYAGEVVRNVKVLNTLADPIPVNIGSASVTVIGDSKISGTVDGTDTGVERTFVNNKKQQVLGAHDLVAAYTWLNFGTKQERVSTIVYTSATFPGDTITRTFAYTLVGANYRLDSETWTASAGG